MSRFVQNEDRHGLKVAPWEDLGRYLRNSPFFYIERVETPVMIIQGDRDFVVIQQGEEWFSAMQRLGKRVRFVRYWGESHQVATTPVNVRDMWQRICAWYDEFGDISRDGRGNMIFEGNRVKSRKGAPPLKPTDYAKFDLFQQSDAAVERFRPTEGQSQ